MLWVTRCRLATALFFAARTLLGQMQLTAPPITSKPEDRCVVAGRVTNELTGEPLRKATVQLAKRINAPVEFENGKSPPGYSTTSLPDGSFKFENVEPGEYALSGNRNGYLNGEYGAKNRHRRGSILSLSPGQQLTDVSFALTPQSVITGKVIDQDGDPVNGAMVQIVMQTWDRGKMHYRMLNGSNTNDLGEYRISGLSPGKYYALVQAMQFTHHQQVASDPGKPDLQPLRTFYPEAPTMDAATPLQLGPGQYLTDIDIRLRAGATYHIRGKVLGNWPEGGADPFMVNASADNEDENMFFTFGAGSVIAKQRTFDIAGLAPGSYTLHLFGGGPQVKPLAQQDVEIGQADLNDVQLMIVQPGTMHGQVTLEGAPKIAASAGALKNVQIVLVGTNSSRMMFGNEPARPKDDGSFVLENVAPGKYYLNANPPDGTYLKSVRFGNQEILGKELDVTQGFGQVSLVFSYGVAEVDGTVQLPQNTPAAADSVATAQPLTTPEFQIALVPQTPHEDRSGTYFGNSGGGGAFSIKGVAPGRYHAYALEQMDYGQMENPDVLKLLESKGVEIDVNENDKKQIQLPLITEDEMQQIYTRLGIEIPQQ
ncbi:MAG: carboxypeptidase regulatory-like domain-containing protein [Acidobacteriaceae bacterium]|nr:carboxypeptidase regulatory-like domain-containing protein [Acidobacteriaceae bacterium]